MMCQVNAIVSVVPTYLQLSERAITFNMGEHPNNIPDPGRYPLIIDPLI